jgi:integrase
MRMMRVQIGARHIDNCDGRDLKRWFTHWSTEDSKDGHPQIAKARMAIAVLRAATTFGIACRKPGCVEFSAVIGACTFESLKPRTAVITSDQIERARAAAHLAGHPGAALAYALQFEGAARQWDIIGEWVPLFDKRPSAVLHNGWKWIGPTWANIDANLVLRFTPGKTQTTTEAEVVIDLAACPMVMDEITGLAPAARIGPLIMDYELGHPYTKHRYGKAWKAAAKAADIPASVWNRDIRASGTTEAREAGARTDDIQKLMAHAPGSPTTSTVYDRALLEAHRRIAEARRAHRAKK